VKFFKFLLAANERRAVEDVASRFPFRPFSRIARAVAHPRRDAVAPLTSFPSNPALALALEERGYLEPTPVQLAVTAPDTAGRDLLVSAQTGSGKTVAYGVAMAQTLLGDAPAFAPAGAPLALVVAPTRELALQVERELTWLYGRTGARIAACVGGMDAQRERRALQAGVHVVVGTPGRLRDHIERRALDVSALAIVVLDEADEMLDLGFREDLEFMLAAMPAEKRSLLFSATVPKGIATLARSYQRDALRIEVERGRQGHVDIEYRAVRIYPQESEAAVVNLLRLVESPTAIVFCNTREAVRHLSATLTERGFAVVTLSGELSQHERNQAMQALRNGRSRVLVATDVAARGIDLPHVGIVIHADPPRDVETLQHRSGRTGRAGRKGVSAILTPFGRRRSAERLFAEAGIQPLWVGPPSAAEVRALDAERFLADPSLAEPASEEDLEMARGLLAERGAEEIAAALVRLYRARLPAIEEVTDPGERGRDASSRPVYSERPAPRARPAPQDRDYAKPARSGAKHALGGGAWFRIDIGRAKGADPKWLLPMICRAGGLTKADIGTIRVFDHETKFEISAEAADKFTADIKKRVGETPRIEPMGREGSAAPKPGGKPDKRTRQARKAQLGREA
jgi:ATP-dependent RNA helicase DeaD